MPAATPAPASEAALAFLDEAAKGKATEKALPADIALETRTGDKALYFETRRGAPTAHSCIAAIWRNRAPQPTVVKGFGGDWPTVGNPR